MKISSLFSLFLTLCLILIFKYPLSTNARTQGYHRLSSDAPDLIGYICNQTLPTEKTKCTQILKGDPKIVSAKNFVDFSKAFLKLALNKAIKGQKFLEGLVKTKYDPTIAECANSCYVAVVADFKGALKELRSDPLSANYDIFVAHDEPVRCERLLAIAHIVNPAISALNNETMFLSYIAFLATNEIS